MKFKDFIVRRLGAARPAEARGLRTRRRSTWLPETLEPRTLLAASLVKDLNIADVTISAMLGVGAKEYYASRNASGSVDLFVTDGTALGTSQLASFPGTGATTPLSNLTSVGSQVYFTVDQGSNGLALWKTDGTSAGTTKVKEVLAQGGQGNSTWYPSSLTAVGNRLYFVANDGVTGTEVWTSDGTANGTVALDAKPGLPGLNPAARTLFGVGSTLYVSTHSQLYKYDGSTGAPVAVTGAPGAIAGSLASLGTKLFYSSAGQFYALDTTNDSLSTLGVPASELAFGETVAGSRLFFFTIDTSGPGTRLWSSDGTAAGTQVIKTVGASVPNYAAYGVAAGNNFVFTMDDGSGPALWRSDGTAGGTVAVTAGGNPVTNPTYLASTGTRVYYTRPGGSGPALWMTETAPGGTSLQLLDLTPFAGGGGVRMISGSGGSVYAAFAQTTDGVGRLIRSDGTIGGSGVFREFTPAATQGSDPRSSVSVSPGQLLFVATDINGFDGLWVTNGTGGGTNLLQSFDGTNVVTPAPMTLFQGKAYFLVRQAVYSSTNEGLWSSDGGSAALIASIDRLQGADSMVVFNNMLYFNTTPDGAFQPTQLRRSDGTAGGTSIFQTFNAVTDLVDGGNRLYLKADDGSGSRLWSLAAGAGAAAPVVDTNGNPLVYPSRVTMVGQTPFVVAGLIDAKRLYRINPATGVASVVTDTGSNPVAVNNTPYLGSTGSALVFNGLAGGAPVLWVVGTAGPAGLVTLGGQTLANPGQPVALGGTAYFAADGGSGRELYRFDGSTAAMVKDINPALGNANPTNLSVVGSNLVFLADDGVHGSEPWISNGTAGGTVAAADVAPGSAGAAVGTGGLVLGQVNGRVLLALSDGSRGVEPWSMIINGATNTAPTLDPIANQEVLVNQTLSFRAVGTDIDAGQTLTYSLDNPPSGAVIDPVSGVVTWTPSAGGNFTLTVRVTDSGSPAQSVARVVNVKVNSNTTPPPAQSTTTLAVSSPTAAVGQAVTFTATIGNAGANPGGSVTFVSGGNVLGTALVNGTTATFTTSSLAIGGYAVQATYTGGIALGSSSNVVNLNVGSATTTTTLGATATSVSVGQPVTLTVQVSSPSGTPTGGITVLINGGWPAVANLVNGAAVVTFNDLPVGNYTFTAFYNGQGGWSGSASTAQAVSVQGVSTSTALAVASSTVEAGQPVTLTANVGSTSGTPTGTVRFLINGGWPVVANLVNGVATASIPNLPVGNYVFTAEYLAAGSWSTSTSAGRSVSVTQSTTTILAGAAGITVKPKGNGVSLITLNASHALNKTSALNAANYTLYVGRKVRVRGKLTIVYDRAVRPTVKYTAGSSSITLTPPRGRLAIPGGVNAKLVVNGLVDERNKAVPTYAVFFNKRGLVGVTSANVVRVTVGPGHRRV